jgi:hypothetical protein
VIVIGSARRTVAQLTWALLLSSAATARATPNVPLEALREFIVDGTTKVGGEDVRLLRAEQQK